MRITQSNTLQLIKLCTGNCTGVFARAVCFVRLTGFLLISPEGNIILYPLRTVDNYTGLTRITTQMYIAV